MLKRLLLLLIPYELCRIFYYAYNHHYFADVGFKTFLHYLFIGLRFDVPAIIMVNLPFVILSLVPFGSEDSIFRKQVLKTIFVVINSLAIFMQLGDTVFLSFVYKRSTADVFKFLSLGSDSEEVMPSVVRDYWYILVLWGLMTFLVYLLYSFTEKKRPFENTKNYVATSIASYMVITAILVLGFRGGWQARPLTLEDASYYAPVHDVPLVINTPFSIFKTLGVPPLKEKNFYTPDVCTKIYCPYKDPSTKPFRKLNVVTIILESFSKEYIGALNNRHKTNTPFLDSLISQSLVFDNAFSDGKKSIEGIPSVTAGMPSWMDEPYATSQYSHDSINTLPTLLGKEGYTTAFFHGGTNGTMDFTNYCKRAGFKYYYGRTEYHNDADYDVWGIWDEPFFQYFAKNLDTLHKPFYANIFSLSSHHPFHIPAKYASRFPRKGQEMEILKCIRYSDLALKEFFETASKKAWYDSTLFVFVADHAGPSEDPYYSNRLGMYELPIIFFMPHSNLKGRSHTTIQQIDIMPTILGYLNYPHPYFAFGNNAFDSTANHFAVNYINDVYQICRNPYCLQMEGNRITALYNYQKDSMLTHNLIKEKPLVKDSLSSLLEAVMQTYNNSVIHNDMQIKKGGPSPSSYSINR
ncbi:MAG TPA: sulfatase-like hydrolase/transferase [Bacteroidia bacterium]|nr:sulfatase-like hydrolase/transferase [Bacteroidia bacterium]